VRSFFEVQGARRERIEIRDRRETRKFGKRTHRLPKSPAERLDRQKFDENIMCRLLGGLHWFCLQSTVRAMRCGDFYEAQRARMGESHPWKRPPEKVGALRLAIALRGPSRFVTDGQRRNGATGRIAYCHSSGSGGRLQNFRKTPRAPGSKGDPRRDSWEQGFQPVSRISRLRSPPHRLGHGGSLAWSDRNE
jgi:hypothetical protein